MSEQDADTVDLPPESIKLVLSMIDRIRQVEGLPPAQSAELRDPS